MLWSPFSATVAEALMLEHVNLIVAAELDFVSGYTRVHSGTGNVVINGNVFMGVGVLGQVDKVKEQNTTSATQLNLTLGGLDTSLISIMMNEYCVGRLVGLYLGVLNDDGVLVDADLLFRGKMRNTAVLAGENGAINITVSNIFEDWSKGKSWRYTDESQRKKNDGDRIFRYVAQMSDRSIYWGSSKDAPSFRYD